MTTATQSSEQDTPEITSEDQARALFEQLAARQDAPATDSPKAEPAADATPERRQAQQNDADGKAGEETARQEDDPWAGVNPALRKALEVINSRVGTIEQATKAAVGRVGALQSEMAKVQEAFRAGSKAAERSGAETPDASRMAQATKSPEAWERVKKDFPEWAEGVEAALEARLAGLPKAEIDPIKTELDGTKTALQQLQEENAALARQLAERDEMLVELRHPGWEGTVKTEAFRAWFLAQAGEVKRLADSKSPRDAIKLLDMYAEHQKSLPDPKQVEASRKRNLSAAASTPRGPSGAAHGHGLDAMTDEELFNHFASKRAR